MKRKTMFSSLVIGAAIFTGVTGNCSYTLAQNEKLISSSYGKRNNKIKEITKPLLKELEKTYAELLSSYKSKGLDFDTAYKRSRNTIRKVCNSIELSKESLMEKYKNEDDTKFNYEHSNDEKITKVKNKTNTFVSLFKNREIKKFPFDGYVGLEKVKGEYAVISVKKSECTQEALADLYYNYFHKNKANNLKKIYLIYSDNEYDQGATIDKDCIRLDVVITKKQNGECSAAGEVGKILYKPNYDGKTIKELCNFYNLKNKT